MQRLSDQRWSRRRALEKGGARVVGEAEQSRGAEGVASHAGIVGGQPVPGALYEINSRPVPARLSESSIPRHQWCTERFRQGDVGGVVRRDPGPELPDAPEQRSVWVAPNGKIGELRDCLTAALRTELARGAKPSD